MLLIIRHYAKTALPTLIALILFQACATQGNLGRTSIIDAIHIRVVDGDKTMLAGGSLRERIIFAQGAFTMEGVSIYLEDWKNADTLRSRTEIFHGRLTKSEQRCGIIYIKDSLLDSAVICVEKLDNKGAAAGTTHTTRYSLRELLKISKASRSNLP